MEIQLFYEFALLAKTLNFSRAAQKLNITQPVLSRHIRFLEERIGAKLFIRDTHKVELTSAGELFCKEIEKMISQYESCLATMKYFTGKSRRALSIAFLGEATQNFLSSFLNHFKIKYKDIQLDCRDCELDEVLFSLDNHAIDLGLLITPNTLAHIHSLCSLPFRTDPLCIAVNKVHPLAKRTRVSLYEASQWPVIRVDPAEFPLSDKYSTHFFTTRNLPFRLDKEYPNLKTCCFNLEFSQRAIVMMPRHRKNLVGENCVLLEISDEDCWFNLELAWDSKNINPALPVLLREFTCFLAQSTHAPATAHVISTDLHREPYMT